MFTDCMCLIIEMSGISNHDITIFFYPAENNQKIELILSSLSFPGQGHCGSYSRNTGHEMGIHP